MFSRRPVAVSFPAWCFLVSILCCVFEAVARKWVYHDSPPWFQGVLYFLKDVPLAAAFVHGLFHFDLRSPLRPFRLILLVATACAGVAAVAANVESVFTVGALVTWRGLIALPWLAVIVGPHLRGKRDIAVVCHAIGICAAINAVLGASQFALPADNILNQQTTSLNTAVGDIGRVRASGTFAYITGMGDLCTFACWAGAVLIGRELRNPVGYVYIVCGLLCASTAMSRTGVFTGLTLILLTLLSSSRGRWLAVAGGIVTVLLYFSVGSNLVRDSAADEPTVTTAIIERQKKADTLEERLFGTVAQLPEAILHYPTGAGIGDAQTAQKAVVTTIVDVYEWDIARVTYEVGVLGLMAAVLWRVLVPLLLWLRPRATVGSDAWLPIRRPGLWWMSLSFFVTPVFDHITATFLAIAGAFVFRTVVMEEESVGVRP